MRQYFRLSLFFSTLYCILFLYFKFWTTDCDSQWTDGGSYLEAANLFFKQKGSVSATRPFGNALYFGLPLLFENGVAWQRIYIFIVQYVVWLMTILGLYSFLKKIALPYAWYLSLFFGFNLSGLMITAQIASEPPTILGLLMTLYACFLAHRSQKHLFWNSIAFLMLCCATLIRPQTQYLILFLAIYACWCALKVNNMHFLKQFLLITCLFCTTIGYQLFQMKQIHHHSALSIIPNYACYVYLSAYAEVIDIPNKNVRDSTWQTIEMARWRELNEISKQKNAGYAAQYAQQHFLEKLDSQPLRIFKTWIRDILSNSAAYCGNLPDGTINKSSSDSIIISILKIWTRLYNLIYSGFILIIIPMMILIRNKKLKINPLWVVSWLVCLYCILTAGVSFAQGDRFHLIFFPIAIICFASFCDNFKIKV